MFRQIGKEKYKEIIYQRELKVAKPGHGVQKIIKCTVESHGFDGFLGLCEGHSMLSQIYLDTERAGLLARDLVSLEIFLERTIRESSETTATQALEAWKKEKAAVVSVGISSTSCASSLTESIVSYP